MSTSARGNTFISGTKKLMLSNRLLNAKISDLLFAISLFAWVFLYAINMSFFAIYLVGVLKYVRIACLMLLLLSELLSMRITIKYLGGLALAAIVAIVGLMVGQGLFVDTVAYIVCSRNREFKFLAKICLAAIASVVVLVAASAYLGIIQNYVSFGARTRVYMGFRYALYPSAFLFSITLLVIYLKGDKFSLGTALGLVLINMICYLFTDSRLSFGIAILVISLIMIRRFAHGRLFSKKWFGILFCSCFVLAATLSLALEVAYTPTSEWFRSLDTVLGGRLQMGHRAFDEYGITLFGTNLKSAMIGSGLDIYGQMTPGEHYYVDCLYLRMLIESGAVVFVIYLTAMTALCWQSWKLGDSTTAVVLLGIAIHGMVDNLFMNLYFNPFLLMIGALLAGANVARRYASYDVINKHDWRNQASNSNGEWFSLGKSS